MSHCRYNKEYYHDGGGPYLGCTLKGYDCELNWCDTAERFYILEKQKNKLAEQNEDMLGMIKIWESITGPPLEPTWNSIRKEMRELIARIEA